MSEFSSRPSKIHFINHHVWPDGSPVCIATEQVAICLSNRQIPVVMVGSSGKYRSTERLQPAIEYISLKTPIFGRENVFQNIKEYLFVFFAFWKYVRQFVHSGDMLIVTSAPPINALLRYALWGRKVKTIFWLFDYFPGYLFPLRLPKFLYGLLRTAWDYQLNKYNCVIKISGNLGYWKQNAVVYRLWPTISIPTRPITFSSNKQVLYSGNLGMAHNVQSIINTCEKLRNEGYEISIHADGPGVEKLPDWLKAQTKKLLTTEQEYRKALLEHDVHLIAGTVGSDELSFPSKIWNSLAAGKQLIPCGFYGRMEEEYKLAITSRYSRHLPELVEYIESIFLIDKQLMPN